MKSIIFMTAVLFVLAPAIHLSAENVTGSTDSAQQGRTDQRRGTVTTEKQEGNNQKLPDDHKNGGNNVSRAWSVRESQPNPTSAFAFPSDSKNILQQNTNAVGPNNGQMQTFHSQNGGYVQRTDTMNSKEWSGEDIATTGLATNDHQSVTTMKPTATNTIKEQSYEDFATTVPRANDAWSITTMQPIYTNHFEEHSHEGLTTPFSRINDDQSITTMQPIDTNNFEEQSDVEFRTPVPGYSDDQSVNPMQPTDAYNSEGQSYEDIGTTVVATNDNQSVTTIRPTNTNTFIEHSNEDFTTEVPGANYIQSIANMQPIDINNVEEQTDEDFVNPVLENGDNQSVTTIQPTQTNNSKSQSGEDFAIPVPETIGDHLITTIQPIDTNNIKEQSDEDFVATVPRSDDEESFTAAVATFPTTLALNVDTMDTNGAPTGTPKAKQEHEYEEVTKKQYFNFKPSDETNSFMDPRASTALAPTSSPSLLLTTPGDVENHVQQNGKPQNTPFNANYDDSNSTPEYVHFIPHTATKNSKKEDLEFNITTNSSAHAIGTVATSTTLSIIRVNEASVTQQSGESANPTSITYFDAKSTTRPKDDNIKPLTDTKISNEQYEGFRAVTTSVAQGVGMTSTPTPIKVPSYGANPKSQNVDPTSTIFELAYDNTEQTTPEYELVTPSPDTKNTIEDNDEMSSIMALPPHDNLLPSSSPSMQTRVTSDNESDIQLKGESVGLTLQVAQEDNFTITSSSPPFTAPTDSESIEEHSGRQNISLTFNPNEDEPTTTPSSIWFSLPDDDKNLILQDDTSRETTMSFLTIFKILTAVNDNNPLIGDSPNVTTILPDYEENFSTTTAIPDVMTIPTYDEMDVNEPKIETPSNTERSPQELLILFEVHFRMLRVMSITLATVVALIFLNLGCRYWRKRRRGDRTAVQTENSAPEDAAQPSTPQTSNTEDIHVRFSDLLAREENL